jgi:hypothetical protein
MCKSLGVSQFRDQLLTVQTSVKPDPNEYLIATSQLTPQHGRRTHHLAYERASLCSGVLRTHPRTARLRGYESTSSEFVGVTTQNCQTCGRLLGSAVSNHAHNARVRLPSDDRQFTEVLVERENNLTSVLSVGQDCSITGVRRPIDDALDLVTGFGECRCH